MFYGEVFRALNKAGVKYVVAGGIAVVLHGYQRFTKDLDIIAALDRDNLTRLFDAFQGIGYLPKVPVTKAQFVADGQFPKWKKEKGMVVFSFMKKDPPFDLVDMFIEEPISFAKLFEARTVAKAGAVLIPVVSVRHLIRIKKKAGRGKDLDDIAQLNEIEKINKRNHLK